jgi:nanoRNase/pAp phosphatase (c-di-AMP/oligoRNAs hydrolase)
VKPFAKTVVSRSAAKLTKLTELFESRNSLLIVMQDHPDPDAVASATALRRLANRSNVSCSMICSGMVGRSENRALIDYLGLNLRTLDEVEAEGFDLIALVDTQPQTGNNPLPASLEPDIVIDHHPIHKATRSVAFTDIRSSYGATSSILCEYIQAAGIQPDTPLATALLYGIRSDTQDLGRQARKPDFDAHYFLYHYANLRMLAQIQHGPLSHDYYQLLHGALDSAKIVGNAIFTHLGRVNNPDMTGEIADLLVRHEDVQWCLCTGVSKDSLLLSLRARDVKKDAGTVMHHIVSGRGTGGGHNRLAGGQISLTSSTANDEIAELEEWVFMRFRAALHMKGKHRRHLIQ